MSVSTGMNIERLMSVLVSPRVTSKAYQNEESVVFNVLPNATKEEIKAAIELLFGVKVAGLTTLNVGGKSRRFAGKIGRTKDFKKAYVRLAKGEKIELFANAN